MKANEQSDEAGREGVDSQKTIKQPLSPVKLLPRGLGLQQQAIVRLRALASVVDPRERGLREAGRGRGLVVARGVEYRDVSGERW